LIDTNMPVRDELPDFGSGDTYQVTGRSLLMFALQGRGATQRIFDKLAETLVESNGAEDEVKGGAEVA